MSAPLQPLAERFAFNDRFLDMLTEGFTDADWLHRAGPGNHAQWLLGHLASTRRASLRGFGETVEEQPWERHFGMGHEPTAASDDIAPALLREAFIKNGAELRRWLGGLNEAQAAADFRPFPDGSRTVAGVAHFLHFHESYHLGQIGLLRRVCGKAGVV
ncbi:MAG TPA: DinB family protein [Planctomycetota bacterium]|nr:DinB family protein [Planctomycetota bacterium]